MFLEQKNSGVFSPRSMTYLVSDSWPPRLRELCRRGGSEIVGAGGGGWLQGSSTFQTRWGDGSVLELIETILAQELQVQTTQNPNTEEGKWTWVLSPNQEAVCNW